MPAPVTRGVDTPVHLLKRVQVCSLLTSEGSLARHAAATLHRSACRQSRSYIRDLRAAAQERQVNWVVREYGNSASIPTSVLLSFLRQELQARHCAGALLQRRACLRDPTPARGRLRASLLAPAPATAPAALRDGCFALSRAWHCLQGVDLAETQCSAPAAAPAFGHAEHPLADRHFIHAVARRPGQDSMAGFVPGPYLPGPGFGSSHFPTGGSR